jgi:hypothetical protein
LKLKGAKPGELNDKLKQHVKNSLAKGYHGKEEEEMNALPENSEIIKEL